MRNERKAVLAVAVGCVFILGCGSPSSAPPPAKSSDDRSEVTTPEEPAKELQAKSAKPPTAIKAGWGTLRGRFVYDGKPPAASPLTINKDQEVCGKHNLVDESLVVQAGDSGLANVVIALYMKRGQKPPKPHESLQGLGEEPVVLDNAQCRFAPHVVILQTDQELLIKNSDTVGHNTKIDTLSNPSVNQTIPAGGELKQQFSSAERRPSPVACSIHPWMKGWLVISETPYATVSAKDGSFEIANLPSGEWEFQVWHEKAGAISEIVLDGKKTKWSKGRVELVINGDATTDLGEIKVAPAAFE